MDIDAFFKTYANHPRYKAPRGASLHAKSWLTEAPLRMLLNNLDEEVAENPAELIVYGGNGQAARSQKDLENIIRALLVLEDDETLLIQSGKPVGILPTHPLGPRVLLANSNLVPAWANWDNFFKLKDRGLIMYGQMTAGSWIYIGTQGIVQGTYETFAELAKQKFGGSLKERLVVTAGLGGMGGAQPLAVTLNKGVCLAADVDKSRIEKRLKTRYLDVFAKNYEEALTLALNAKKSGKPLSIGIEMNAVDLLDKLLKDNIIPDAATDQTSAHDPINGYIPQGLNLFEAKRLRESDPKKYREASLKSMASHVKALLKMQKKGTAVFDYGNNIRNFAFEGGEKDAFNIPGFVPEYIRPLFCEGKGPFRWVALSGDPEDIAVTDKALLELFKEDEHLTEWLKNAKEKIAFQGLPARICWLGMGDRKKAGLLFNKLVRERKVKAPIVIGRDHLDAGSVASPYRETENMKDGSDAISDWPLLNALTNTASGATWVSFHHGGGVGMGFSQHAGMVIVADGSEAQEKALARVLNNDPALGVIRHYEAGYDEAKIAMEKHPIDLRKRITEGIS